MDENDEIFYRNLVILFKLFKNSPNHLSKYLSRNSAFSKDFINSIINSKKLNELAPNYDQDYFTNISLPSLTFNDIVEMEMYYDSILEDLNVTENKKEMEIQLNTKLSHLINKEKYEDAAKLRDYMLFNNFEIYH